MTISFDPESNEQGATPNADDKRMFPLLLKRLLLKTGKTCDQNNSFTLTTAIVTGIANFARLKRPQGKTFIFRQKLPRLRVSDCGFPAEWRR
jgi:hypothetical protein